MTDRRRRFEAQALPHLDAAYNLARWLARPPLDADDIVQDAMLRAYRAFDSVRGEDVKPWLLTIVRNCFLTGAGQTRRRQDVPLPVDTEIDVADPALIAGDPDPEAAIMKMQDHRQLNDLILRESLMARLDREDGVQRPGPGRPGFSRRFLSGAASGAGATALAAMLIFFLVVPRPDPLAGDLMNAHLRSLMSDHLIDVASSDRHTVKPWFAGHTDVSPPAADFEKEGYKLIGGRADYVDGHRAAVIVYRHGLHIVNVFAWAAGTEKLPGEVTQKGYHIVCWNSADLDYCAVSDTGMDELLDLVRLIKQQ